MAAGQVGSWARTEQYHDDGHDPYHEDDYLRDHDNDHDHDHDHQDHDYDCHNHDHDHDYDVDYLTGGRRHIHLG